MAPSSLQEKLSNPKFCNWLKGVLILKALQEAIVPFLTTQSQEIQRKVLDAVRRLLPPNTAIAPCPSCKAQNLLDRNHSCPQGVCPIILKQIKSLHRTGQVRLDSSDVQAWSQPTGHWEIAKCFLSGPGYRDCSRPEDTDCTGLVSVIINCTEIHSHLTENMAYPSTVYHRVKDYRNKIMHVADNELEDPDLESLITNCRQILSDQKLFPSRMSAQEALAKIDNIEEEDLKITDAEYQNILQDQLDAMKMDIQELKQHHEELQQNQKQHLEEIQEHQEKQKQNQEETNKQIADLQNRVKVLEQRKADLQGQKEGFRHYLIKKYREKILQAEPSPWFKTTEVLKMMVPLEIRADLERWMTLPREDRKKRRTQEKANDGKVIKSRREIFFKGAERQTNIYLLGEAGVGKSTFCHQLVESWCNCQGSEPKDDIQKELKHFSFLFFIQARHVRKSQSVFDMIQKQSPLKYESALKELFKSQPESCLVLIDGLDELGTDGCGYQELPDAENIEGCTIITTSRQWRIEALDCDLPPSCRVLEIRGLDDNGIESLTVKCLEAFTAGPNSDFVSLKAEFLEEVRTVQIYKLVHIPLLLIIMARSWLDGGRKLEKSRCFLYSGLMELQLIHSRRKGLFVTGVELTDTCRLPDCFNNKENCQKYSSMIMKLAKLAFETLFSDTKEHALVFRKEQLLQQLEVQEHLQVCLQHGLLTESKVWLETKESHRTFSFLHKSVQEFLSAVYLSRDDFDVGFQRVRARVTSPTDVFDYANVIIFLCGMKLTHSQDLFQYMCGVIFYRSYADSRLRPAADSSVWDSGEKLQKMSERCRAESQHAALTGSSTLSGLSPYLVPDLVVDGGTPVDKVEEFLRQGENIKSLVYPTDSANSCITPLRVVETLRSMKNVEKIGIISPSHTVDTYIDSVSKQLPQLQKLVSFRFCVEGNPEVRPSVRVCSELVRELGRLPNLTSVWLARLDLSGIEAGCVLPPHLTSLGLQEMSVPPRFVSGLPHTLTTLHMRDVTLPPPGFVSGLPHTLTTLCMRNVTLPPPGFVSGLPHTLTKLYILYVALPAGGCRQLCQSLSTASCLQEFTLLLRSNHVCDVEFDLTRHAGLYRLELGNIKLQCGLRIHPGSHWRRINMSGVSMSESDWQRFISSLPTVTSQPLAVLLSRVESLCGETLSHIRDKFRVTVDWTDGDRRDIQYYTKHGNSD